MRPQSTIKRLKTLIKSHRLGCGINPGNPYTEYQMQYINKPYTEYGNFSQPNPHRVYVKLLSTIVSEPLTRRQMMVKAGFYPTEESVPPGNRSATFASMLEADLMDYSTKDHKYTITQKGRAVVDQAYEACRNG